MKKIYLILFTIILFSSCVKEIPIGFMSDNLRMREDTFNVVKGIYTVSGVPILDGSTRPLTFEILRVKNMYTGDEAPEFSKTYPVRLWLSPYNPDTDTTMAIVNQKLVVEDILPLEINSVSGQLAVNAGSLNLPGDLYSVDVKISNENTTREFTNFGKIKFEYHPWEWKNNFAEWLYGVSLNGTDPNLLGYKIEELNGLPQAEQDEIKNNTHPRYHIEKLRESETNDVEVKLSFYDSEGKVFPGRAINREPTATSYRNSWFDNSIKTTYLDDGVSFVFPTVPFPAFGRSNSGGRNSISLSYYVLHPDYFTLTPAALAKANKYASDNGVVFKSYNLAVKTVYQINEPGVWEVKVYFRYALRK